MAARRLLPVHPGEILKDEFLAPLGISQYRLAKEIGVPPRRINEIVKGRRAITADTALRLSRYFGLSAQFWMNLQTRYNLSKAEHELGKRIDSEVEHAAWLERRHNTVFMMSGQSRDALGTPINLPLTFTKKKAPHAGPVF